MDVSKIDLTTTIQGLKICLPIMIAPTAMQKMAHPEGMSLKSLVYITFIKILSLFPILIIYNKTVHSHVGKILFLIYWLHS
jgi:hypothetical protein